MRILAMLLLGALDGGTSTARHLRDLPTSGAGHQVGTCAKACPQGQQCVALEVHCFKAPCPPIEECMLP
jgi:hypothetical protein